MPTEIDCANPTENSIDATLKLLEKLAIRRDDYVKISIAADVIRIRINMDEEYAIS